MKPVPDHNENRGAIARKNIGRDRAGRRVCAWVLLLAALWAPQSVWSAEAKESGSMTTEVPAELNTMRPFRTPQKILVSVGQGEGDLQGQDDKVIQAAVDYVHRLGGGTVQILPGTYCLRNAIFLRPGITLRGSGEKTVLKKAASVSSPVTREADWFEYAVQVGDPKGFTPGCGIAISNAKNDWPPVRLFTVTAMRGNVLYLDQRTEKDFWMAEQARVQTLFSILHALNVDDVRIEDIVLDGNRAENEWLHDNFGAAVFMQYCNRWSFRNVIARQYNGDGFSFQVCDDVHFENCQALDNASLGFHSGSGSQRPVFKNCVAKGNSQGLFWCWSSCDGLAEDCVFSENVLYGVNFGHRDTDNLLRRCTIERNKESGIVFRKESNEFRTGDRNRIEGCLIRDNGGTGECGVDIQWKTRDIAIVNCRFENSPNGRQKVALRISPEAERITLEGNSFIHCPIEVQDLRGKEPE